jgi:chloramphenicol 3-O-phosphotransferase
VLQGGIAVPRHIILLNGAPGSGKAANLAAIQRAMGVPYSVEMSALLRWDPQAQQQMATGACLQDTARETSAPWFIN